MPYALAGTFMSVGGPAVVYQQAYLYDVTAGAYRFSADQTSKATADESLVLGGQTGDYRNRIEPGSTLTGSLPANHEFIFFFQMQVYEEDSDGTSTGAIGAISLRLGE